MASLAQISIHPSQFPDQVRRDLIESLRSRTLNHKFLYDGIKQTQKWLALHQACSPSRTDPDCAAIYDQAFAAAATQLTAPLVHLVGLGCGGGQKDARCLSILTQSGKRTSYSPVDVSTAMVLTARQCAVGAVPNLSCMPLVCDLATATDLPTALTALAPPDSQRLIGFFGMIPNFEPDLILPRLAALLRPTDLLLFSANLAPGEDYHAGMRRILPLYDNEPTREWLLAFLLDLGIERADGELKFDIDDAARGMKRIVARFHFHRPREIVAGCEPFLFRAGDSLQVFFSYRQTPGSITALLDTNGLAVSARWVTNSGEEAVFMVRPK